MIEPAADVEQYKQQFPKQFVQLDRLLLNITAINNAQYAYARLYHLGGQIEAEPHLIRKIDMLWEIETLTSGLVMAYGRMFGESKGTTKFLRKDIPKNMRSAHDEIMSFRHERYAHHGKHFSVGKSIEFVSVDGGFQLVPKMSLGFYVGAAPNWAPLFPFLSRLLHERIYKLLDYLSKISGVKWYFPEDGPTPSWVNAGMPEE